MQKIPGHSLPSFSDEALEDALFHYTTADGLIGIFQNKELWSTAHYCANDESELITGKGILTPLFKEKSYELEKENDPRVNLFRKRGTSIIDFADGFEQQIIALTFNSLSAYITCFCKPNREEDFHHGLLSQWRGYGADGGYALQFSRKKLLNAIAGINESTRLNYELQDVYYSTDNPLKTDVLKKEDAYVNAYLSQLDEITKPLSELFNRKTMPNPIVKLIGGPLESLLEYMVKTKNKHFSEENECRLSLIQLSQPCSECLPVSYFNHKGLLVPYTKTPQELNILDCVDWIVIGPGPRLEARMKSVTQLIRQSGRKIAVRPSHIPFTRL